MPINLANGSLALVCCQVNPRTKRRTAAWSVLFMCRTAPDIITAHLHTNAALARTHKMFCSVWVLCVLQTNKKQNKKLVDSLYPLGVYVFHVQINIARKFRACVYYVSRSVSRCSFRSLFPSRAIRVRLFRMHTALAARLDGMLYCGNWIFFRIARFGLPFSVSGSDSVCRMWMGVNGETRTHN